MQEQMLSVKKCFYTGQVQLGDTNSVRHDFTYFVLFHLMDIVSVEGKQPSYFYHGDDI